MDEVPGIPALGTQRATRWPPTPEAQGRARAHGVGSSFPCPRGPTLLEDP